MEFEFGHSLIRFLLVFARVGAFVLAIPQLATILNFRLRFGLATLISISTAMPWIGIELQTDEPLVFLGLQEVILGGLFGIGVSLLLSAAAMSGGWVSRISGGSLAAASYGGKSPFSTLFVLLTCAIFFSVGGPSRHHRRCVGVVRKLPVGVTWDVSKSLEFLIHLLSTSFEFAFRFAFPILFSVLLSGVLTAIVAKFISYFGFFSIGITTNVGVTLLALLLFLATMGWTFQTELADSLRSIGQFTELLVR